MVEATTVPARHPDSPGAVCCGLSSAGLIDREQADETAALLKAVADPTRLQLLSLTRHADGGEACACDLVPAVHLSQPTVSHHLKILTESGLLTRKKRGTWAWYSIVPSRLADLAALFG